MNIDNVKDIIMDSVLEVHDEKIKAVNDLQDSGYLTNDEGLVIEFMSDEKFVITIRRG